MAVWLAGLTYDALARLTEEACITIALPHVHSVNNYIQSICRNPWIQGKTSETSLRRSHLTRSAVLCYMIGDNLGLPYLWALALWIPVN